MKNEFIPYEEALALKELGFDEPCLRHYDNDTDSDEFELSKFNNVLSIRTSEYIKNSGMEDTLAAPLYQQAFRFFRDKYNLYCGFIAPCTMKISEAYMSSFEIVEGESNADVELNCIKSLIELTKNR